jgi:hypothetical protein
MEHKKDRKKFRKEIIKKIKKENTSNHITHKKFFERLEKIDELTRVVYSEKGQIANIDRKAFEEFLDNMTRFKHICDTKSTIKDSHHIKTTINRYMRYALKILESLEKGRNLPAIKRTDMLITEMKILKEKGYIDEKGDITKKGKESLEKYKHMLR